nr:DUF3888 domain-containing protein [uncultured Acetatifactor sp.]
MKGDRFISVCLLISLVFLLFGIFDRDRKPAAGTFSVDSGTEEEITDELVIALFIEDITNEITDFYSAYYSGEITVYNYEVIIVGIVKEEPGFISVRFGVAPQIGAHNPLGYDELAYRINSSGDKELIGHEHLKDYEVPERFRKYIIKQPE